MSRIKIIFLVLAVLSVVAGVVDIYLQVVNDEPVRWRAPLILFGLGVGIPLIIWFPLEWSSDSTLKVNMSEEEYAQSNLNGGFLRKNAEYESSNVESFDSAADFDGDDD